MHISRPITLSLSAILVAASALTAEDAAIAATDLPDSVRTQFAQAAGGAALSNIRIVDVNGQKTYVATYHNPMTGSMEILNVDQNGRAVQGAQPRLGTVQQTGTTAASATAASDGKPQIPPLAPVGPGPTAEEPPTITTTPPPGTGPGNAAAPGAPTTAAGNGATANPSSGELLPPRRQANPPPNVVPYTQGSPAAQTGQDAQPARPGLQHADPSARPAATGGNSSSAPVTTPNQPRPGQAGAPGSTQPGSTSGAGGSGKAGSGSGSSSGSSGGSGK